MRKEKYFGISGCCMLTIMKRSLIAVVAGILLIGGAFQQAGAAPITFCFQGTVDNVDSVLSGTFNTTQTISGSYTFDSALTDTDPATAVGNYTGVSLSFTIGSYTGSGPNGTIFVFDDTFGSNDAYLLRVGSISGPQVAGLDPLQLNMDLLDNTRSVFSSDALPIALNLSSFSSATWSLPFGDPGTPPLVSGQITTITFGECAADTDGDGILDDGDSSGVAGDNPCTGGNTVGCDDNCPSVPNPDQTDVNDDGHGDACLSPNANIGDNVDIGYGVVIGDNVTIKEYASVGDGSVIGANSEVKENATVGSNVTIGDDVTVKEGAQVGNGCTIGSGSQVKEFAEVGDGTTIGENTEVKEYAKIGINCCIGSHVIIGEWSDIGDNTKLSDGSQILANTVIPDSADPPPCP